MKVQGQEEPTGCRVMAVCARLGGEEMKRVTEAERKSERERERERKKDRQTDKKRGKPLL